MTIYGKDAKRSGYASPREVAAMKATTEQLRSALRRIRNGADAGTLTVEQAADIAEQALKDA